MKVLVTTANPVLPDGSLEAPFVQANPYGHHGLIVFTLLDEALEPIGYRAYAPGTWLTYEMVERPTAEMEKTLQRAREEAESPGFSGAHL